MSDEIVSSQHKEIRDGSLVYKFYRD